MPTRPDALHRAGGGDAHREALGVRMIPHVLREELSPAEAKRMMRVAMGARFAGVGTAGAEEVSGEEERERGEAAHRLSQSVISHPASQSCVCLYESTQVVC